ncbi:MAG: TatD family hydrolase [bacterium]
MNQPTGLLIDSHAHLDSREFDEDRCEVIRRAWDAGLKAMITIGAGGDPATGERAVETAQRHAGIYATVGIHPHDAQMARPGDFLRLCELARHPKVVAIGEVGLDYHYMHSPARAQQEVFRQSLLLSAETDLPVVIHTRKADSDTLDLLREAQRERELKGVVHCFSGDYAFARSLLDLGMHLSFTGLITFPKAEPVCDALRRVPLDRVLLETDSPYLAPVPYRGHRNEPAYVARICEKTAEILGRPFDEIAWVTGRNVIRLFGLTGLREAADP